MASPISIQHYFSLRFGMVAALPVVIIAFLVRIFLMPSLEANTGIQHYELARSIAGQISIHLKGGQHKLTALADFLESQAHLPPRQIVSLLDSQCGSGELFETIYIADSEDDTIRNVGLAHSRRPKRDDLMGLDLSGRHFIYKAKEMKQAVWSDTFLSTVSSRLAVAVTLPLPGGYITGEITLDKLSELISLQQLEARSLTFVIDHQGRIVADSQRQRWGRHVNMAALPANKHKEGDRFTSTLFKLNGMQLLGTIVEIDQPDLRVLVAQPVRTAYKPLRTMFMTLALGLAAALALSLAISWLQARKLSRLFQSYTEKARSIADGRYALQWPRSNIRELLLLGKSLQHMAQMIEQREKALTNSETRLDITLNSIGDAVIATDTLGLITRMNPIAEKLTGWQSDIAVGKRLTEIFRIINAHTRQPIENPVDTLLAKRERGNLSRHTLLIDRNGQEHYITENGSPIRHTDGRMVGVVLVFRDVTERVRMEEMMVQSEKMLSVGGLAAGMAHEINNPLAGIMQTAGVMANRLGASLHIPANRRAAEAAGTTIEAVECFMEARSIPRMLATITESGRRVAEIIDNMLSFARKGDTAVSSHRLETLLDKSLELAATDYDLRKNYDFRQIKIIREYAGDMPPIPCESAKIQQVLLNIFGNGVQAMQGGGAGNPRFIVRTYFEEGRQMACMEIEDNGPGMDKATCKRVFEPFFTTKPVGVGTGLGLSVSFFIITENHNGEIAVESQPGCGATFIIRLPVNGRDRE